MAMTKQRQRFLASLARRTYFAPVFSLFMYTIVFLLPGELLESSYRHLEGLGLPMFQHYTRLYSDSEHDWQQRVVAIYVMFLASPLIVGSAIYFMLRVLDPFRRPYLSWETRHKIFRLLFLLVAVVAAFLACLFFPGKDMTITNAIPNTIGLKSGLMSVGGLWALGGTVGLLVSEIVYFRKHPFD